MTEQPIKPFREWFADKYGVPFPGDKWERSEVVFKRAFDAMADYIDITRVDSGLNPPLR